MEDHPSFSTGRDSQIPYRSLLFQNACQRVKHSFRDLERTRNSTTAETKKPFKTTGMIYEWGPETSTKLIVGNALARPEIRPRYTFPGSWTYGKPGWPLWPLPLVFHGNVIAWVCVTTSSPHARDRDRCCLCSRKLQQQLACQRLTVSIAIFTLVSKLRLRSTSLSHCGKPQWTLRSARNT